MTLAASYSRVRTRLSPHFEVPPTVDAAGGESCQMKLARGGPEAGFKARYFKSRTIDPSEALVQIAGAGKRPVLYCRDFKLGARHSTLQAQVDLGHPDVRVRIVPCGCDASIRCRRS